MRHWLLVVLLLLSIPVPAYAWGDQGHHLTCQIAYGALTPTARREVDRLLSSQSPKYRKFAKACTYPDAVKDDDGRRGQHFVNLRRDAAGLVGIACPVAANSSDCLVAAIDSDYAALRDAELPVRERGKALMYLGHWLGDLHQPLHISFKDDIGGGKILTTGKCAARGGTSKLHSIWDTCIIVHRIFAQSARRAMTDDRRFFETSDTLRTAVSPVDAAQWRLGEPWAWANESFAITRIPDVLYCTRAGNVCRYEASREVLGPGEVQRRVEINEDYVSAFAPTVRERLQRGGIRLAHLLNAALDPDYR